MSRLHRPVRVLAVTSVMVCVLASCGEEGGKALPGGQGTPPPATSTAPSSAPAQGGGELEKIKACELLTDQDVAAFSKGFAAEDTGPGSGTSSSCAWSTSIDRGVPIDKYVGIGINIRPWQTVDQTSSGLGSATDGDVEGRKAKRVAEHGGDGTCLLAFAAESGRLDITVQTKQTAERACEIASEVSTLIEPKLPEPTG